MKSGRPLPSLAQELELQASHKRDFIAPAGQLQVHSNANTSLVVNDSFPLLETGHTQLADYLGIPKGFYDRLRSAFETLQVPLALPAPPAGELMEQTDPQQLWLSEATPLFDCLVNRLLTQKGEDRRLVRTLDGKARAFLSDSYSLDLDHLDVFKVAARALEEAGLCPDDVRSCEVTERRLYLKVVSPKLEAVIHPSNLRNPHGMLKEPQVVQAGFVLSNSETGLGSLAIQQTVFKLMCTNLWTVEDAYKRRHLGKVLESSDDGQVYRSDTRQAEAKAQLLKIRDHVADALNETRFQALVARMQETTEVKLEGRLEKIVEVTSRKFGLNHAEQEETLKNLIEGADLSLWGLTNAITQTAQSAGDYDRASDLEAIGGRCFQLSRSEVKELATAA